MKGTETARSFVQSFHRFQQKQITYRILYAIYFGKYFKNNVLSNVINYNFNKKKFKNS